MDIFVYADESGVFDRYHHDKFVFGGVIFLDKDEKDLAYRKYVSAERTIKGVCDLKATGGEAKACALPPKHKSSLFKLMAPYRRYAFVIDLKRVYEDFFNDKKSKQRYMDYAFKVGLKTVLGKYVRAGVIDKHDVGDVLIRFDQHTTATNGRYELKESIEEEFKHGMNNFKYNIVHPPLFPSMRGSVGVKFTDSKADAMIRASDIVANMTFHYERSGTIDGVSGLSVVRFP